MRAFHDCPYRYRKRLATILALEDAGAGTATLQFGDTIPSCATARASRTMRPQQCAVFSQPNGIS
jgi:hypothetical protein